MQRENHPRRVQGEIVLYIDIYIFRENHTVVNFSCTYGRPVFYIFWYAHRTKLSRTWIPQLSAAWRSKGFMLAARSLPLHGDHAYIMLPVIDASSIDPVYWLRVYWIHVKLRRGLILARPVDVELEAAFETTVTVMRSMCGKGGEGESARSCSRWNVLNWKRRFPHHTSGCCKK